MNRAVGIVALSLGLVLLGAAPGAAQGKGNALRIQPAEFDPEHVCEAKPDWVRGVGLFAPDDRFAAAFVMRQNPGQAFPTVPTNATIVNIALVFDEGPDTDPNGSPEIVLDNVFINGKFATKP